MKDKKIIIVLSIVCVIIIALLSYLHVRNDNRIENVNPFRRISSIEPNYIEPIGRPTPEETLAYAAKAIENGDMEESLKMFDSGAHDKIRKLLSNFSTEGKKRLALDLKNATLDENGEIMLGENDGTIKIYKTEIPRVGGLPHVTTHFSMIKLPSGNWVIMNL